MNKDNEFLEQNKDLILMNLLQAEIHLNSADGRFRSGQSILPEHGACVLKHLLIAEGEALEAVNHCRIAEPQGCAFFAEFRDKVNKLRKDFEKNGFNKDSLEKVRALRKEFEKYVQGYDTTQCELCSNIGEYLKKKEDVMNNEQEINQLDTEDINPQDRAYLLINLAIDDRLRLAKDWVSLMLEEDTKGSVEVFGLVLKKFADLYKLFDSPNIPKEIAHKAQAIFLDPLSKSTISKLEAKGCELLPHPICVLSKESQGMSKEQAGKECLAEGKVHGISVLKCETK